MISIETIIALLCISGAYGFNQDTDWSSAQSFFDFHIKDLQGNDVSLEKYRGHPVIAFNGATHCPVSNKNFKLLQAMQEQYASAGLKVLTFAIDGLVAPSGTNEDIQKYLNEHNFSLEVFEKIHSDGDEAHPIYKWLKSQLNEKIHPASKILIDKNGKVVSMYQATGPLTNLEDQMKEYL